MSRRRRGWVGATTLQANACKEKQRPQVRCLWFNRARSAVTQLMNCNNAEKVGVHSQLPGKKSGQLPNPGFVAYIGKQRACEKNIYLRYIN